jgi:putative inorganic carbon (hco3(-)) transporter
MVMQSKQRIFALVWVAVLSLGYFGVKGGIYTIIRGGEGMVLGPGAGIHSHRNAIAVALVMIMPLMYWLLLQTDRRWLRLGMMGAMALTAVSVFGTFSRGGFLAIGAMGAFLWLKSRNKLAIALLLLILVPPALEFMPERWHARMGTIETYQEDGSSMERISAWYMAWKLALDRPILGAGFDCFRPEAFARWGDPARFGLPPGMWHDAHSIWFRVLAEHGFFGLGLWLLFWFASWRTAARVIALTRGHEELRWARDLVAMVQVSVIGYLVGGSFINIQYWDFPYILVALVVLTKVVVQRELGTAATADASSPTGDGLLPHPNSDPSPRGSA